MQTGGEAISKPSKIWCMCADTLANLTWEGLLRKAKVRTGFGKTDRPGLQGGFVERDYGSAC